MSSFVKSRLPLLILLVGLTVFAGLLARYFLRTAPPPAPPAVAEPRHLREVQLYFATADGTGLVAENREIEGCADEESCLRATLEALIAGPRGELVAVLPPATTVQRTVVAAVTATVSFSPELVAGHPGGSMSELLTVHALTNTLAVNFPHVRQVRILVDGAPVETLKGHVDLREPIAADFDFGRPQTQTGAPPAGGE